MLHFFCNLFGISVGLAGLNSTDNLLSFCIGAANLLTCQMGSFLKRLPTCWFCWDCQLHSYFIGTARLLIYAEDCQLVGFLYWHCQLVDFLLRYFTILLALPTRQLFTKSVDLFWDWQLLLIFTMELPTSCVFIKPSKLLNLFVSWQLVSHFMGYPWLLSGSANLFVLILGLLSWYFIYVFFFLIFYWVVVDWDCQLSGSCWDSQGWSFFFGTAKMFIFIMELPTCLCLYWDCPHIDHYSFQNTM